ncbi:TonB C-terminal domain-containing protein [bacterium]|nr:TonB C-terminal domain-containing protein [bacterium]
MIYKCKNCGQKYTQKQDYCDCGNNTFIEIKEPSDDIQKRNHYNANSNQEFYDEEKNNKNVINFFAVLLLITAIIISSLLLFKVLTKPHKTQEQSSSEKLVDKEIKQDNQSYNNFFPKEEEIAYDINNSLNAEEENGLVIEIPKTKQKQQTSKLKTNQKIEKIEVKNPTKQQEHKELKQNKQIVKPQKEIKKEIKDDNEVKKINKAEYEKELSGYKNNLRAQLFKNFPILNVSGAGKVKISFSISQSGKLINRKFITQSENKSLNDAVYNMLMQTPMFTPPPAMYKGEEIILNIDFNNGYYSFAYEN